MKENYKQPINGEQKPLKEEEYDKHVADTINTENTRAIYKFDSKADKIKVGESYSIERLELIFDVRWGEQLAANLKNRFEYEIVGKNIKFTKDKKVK